jgi:redox-sensitive bicupin YhaK (pirin superfamily)
MSARPLIDAVIVPPLRDLGGGFKVRRALPSLQRRMIGPFVFFDQMGPTIFGADSGLDVRPHPHIGLATVTYLLEGEILHRDSLGSVQAIRPGEVNWMIAGRGIVHSERTAAQQRRSGSSLFGIQTWIALPRSEEERAPSFEHHAASALPTVEGDGKVLRLIAGRLYGARSPVAILSEMFYADVQLQAEAQLPLPTDQEERAVYLLRGHIDIEGESFEPGQLLVFRPRLPITLRARTAAQLLLLGGAALDGPRHLWWNFVSSSRERIEQAKADWREGRLGTVAGDAEFIPLPDDSRAPAKPVDYP